MEHGLILLDQSYIFLRFELLGTVSGGVPTISWIQTWINDFDFAVTLKVRLRLCNFSLNSALDIQRRRNADAPNVATVLFHQLRVFENNELKKNSYWKIIDLAA